MDLDGSSFRIKSENLFQPSAEGEHARLGLDELDYKVFIKTKTVGTH